LQTLKLLLLLLLLFIFGTNGNPLQKYFKKNFPKKKKAFVEDRTPKHFSYFGEIPNAEQLFPIVFITYFGLG